jgi:hypothetical protein
VLAVRADGPYKSVKDLIDARLLHAAFAKQSLTSFICRPHFLRVVRFGNRDQLDLIDCATNLRRRLCDLFAHPFEIFSNRTHEF